MDAKVFSDMPNVLKTIEVDVEKKIFNVNGEPFGRRCTGFTISCAAGEGFEILMDVNTTVRLFTYKMNGEKKADYVRPKT